MSINDKINQVKSADDLAQFILLLSEDIKQNEDQWENRSIETYLEAVNAWLTSTARNRNVECTWSQIAEIFYVGKIYE